MCREPLALTLVTHAIGKGTTCETVIVYFTERECTPVTHFDFRGTGRCRANESSEDEIATSYRHGSPFQYLPRIHGLGKLAHL